MNRKPLRVLQVEDSESDAALIIHLLKKSGYDVDSIRVETAGEMRSALEQQRWDVVVADYSLPQFSAPAALALLQETGLDIPLIVVSGAIGDEKAVAMMKAGAQDYLMKGNLARLAPAVTRELEEARVRRERNTTLALLRLLTEQNDTRALICKLTGFLQAWADCEAVGVRLRQGEDFPYVETRGFPPTFVAAENCLCVRNPEDQVMRDSTGNPVLECMCGNILCGRFNPALPCFTQRGSFWTNSTSHLLAHTTEADRLQRTRNRCHGEGYESVALIPLQHAGQMLGLLQFNDSHRGRFTPELIAFLESVGDQIALALAQRQTQEALREGDERYRRLFNCANDAIFLRTVTPAGLAGKFVEVNDLACQRLGYSRAELLQKSPLDIDPCITAEQIKGHTKQMLSQEGCVFESVHLTKDGHRIPVELSAHIFEWEGKQMVLSIARDLTERLRAGEALQRSEKRWKALFEYAPDACYLHDLQGTFLEGNQAAEQMIGYRREELAGKSWLQLNLLDAEGLSRAGALLARNARGEATGPDEFSLRRKDGSWIAAEISTYPVEIENQVLVLGIARDISERKRTEAVLKASEERYHRLFESVNDAIFLRPVSAQGPGGNFIEVNGVACQHLGYSREELLQKSPSDIDPVTNLEQVRLRATQVLKGEGVIFEAVHVAKDGRHIPVEISSRLFEWEGRQMMLSIARDLTEHKKLEKELALREQRLNSFFTNSTAGLCILDTDLRYVQINETLARLNGLPVGEHLGKTVFEVLPELAPVLEPLLRQVLATSEPVLNMELHGERSPAPGGLRHWVVSYFPFPGERGIPGGIGCVVVEISEQKRAEEQLRESEEKFRQLAENIDKVFWITDREKAKMLYVSPAYERIWGRSCQSLYEQPSSFAAAIHPEDRERVLANQEREKRGEDYEEEYRIVRPDGSVRWIHDRGFVVRNKQGEFYRLAGLAEDVTERRQLEEQLRQAQKMEAIGQLAGGVAHDFNNILSATLMHLGMLLANPHLTLDTKESLKDVESASLRAASLTRQLLLFSRREVAKFEPLDLNQLIHGLLKMLRRLLGENIEVVSQDPAEAVWVHADAGMLEQVVMNLCINGRDAMPKGGRLALATTMVELGDSPAQPNPNARPGRFACLSVTDTGCGMDEAVLKRIYEPFFTTKEVGKGTGLGLATVYGIVQQHEGWVEVESAVGKGSSFRVYLPAGTRPLGAFALPSGPEKIRGGSETLLLVEDELSMRQTAALCLRKLGYAVLEAGNGLEALQVWKAHREQIKLLFTDMVMPGEMTGLELAQCMRREKASLKVIISSGYSSDLTEPTPLAGQEISYLPKPYKTTLLAKTVRSCLDQT